MGPAVAEIGDRLENTVVIVVQQAETGQLEQRFKNRTETMDEIIIFLVGFNVLVKKGLP